MEEVLGFDEVVRKFASKLTPVSKQNQFIQKIRKTIEMTKEKILIFEYENLDGVRKWTPELFYAMESIRRRQDGDVEIALPSGASLIVLKEDDQVRAWTNLE